MLLSVIIPVYNVEEYLLECLQSVAPQLTGDMELITVDDGSTDHSPEIIRGFMKNFPEIRLITQENRGLSAARNAGIDMAKGKYLWFIDSDDFINLNSVEPLKNRIEKSPELDLLRFDRLQEFQCADTNTFFLEQPMIDSVCTGWYRREFLQKHKLRFEEGFLYEDTLFNLKFYHSHAKMGFSALKVYNYRIREGSISSGGTNLKKLHSVLKILETCDEIIEHWPLKIAEKSLAIRKKLDYADMLAAHLKSADFLSEKDKKRIFLDFNRKIPLLKKDSPGIFLKKLMLNFFPQWFYSLAPEIP